MPYLVNGQRMPERAGAMKRNSVFAVCILASVGMAAAAGPPAPSFYARRDYPDFGAPQVAVADTNGDGIPDLIELDGTVQVWFGNGNGTFRQGPTSATGMQAAVSLVVTKLTGDSNADLIFVGQNSDGEAFGIGVSLGNGDGTFQPAVFYPVGNDTYTLNLALGDFNGDGIIDVATVGEEGIWLFTGIGGGAFNPGELIPFNGAGITDYNYLQAADLRKNGKWNLVVTTPTGFAVLLGNGNGTFQPQVNYANPLQPGTLRTFVLGAIVEGGYPAIAANCSSSEYIALYIGNGKGGFSEPVSVYMQGVDAIADVNGDGIPDLVNAEVDVALGEGDAKFGMPKYYPIQGAADGGGGKSGANVVAAHLRSASLTDLVVQGAGAVSVLLNTSNKGFEDGVWTDLPAEAVCGAVADFNGDGKPDLAVSTALGVSILLGTGSSSAPFTVGTPIPVSGGAGCMVTGDLNGDGSPDLLVPS